MENDARTEKDRVKNDGNTDNDVEDDNDEAIGEDPDYVS